MKRILFLLALLALLASTGLTGCKKVADYYHRYRVKKHEERVAKAAAAAAASATPKPAPAAAPAPDAAVPVAPAAPGALPGAAPAAAVATPTPAHFALNKSAGAIVLCYHNIEDNSKMKALTITIEEFEKEMQALKDNGFTVIPMQDFLAWRRGEKNIPAKSAIVTLDDGWVSAYTNAWPILKKYGYPFTLFIYIDYVNTGGKSMTWDQLSEMRDAGVDIECHTYSHSNLRAPGVGVDKTTRARVEADIKTLGADGWLRKEIIGSKKTLEQQLGIKANVFAYPFGKYDAKARALIKEAGYEAAFTVYGQRIGFSSPPYDLLGRYAIEQGKPQIFNDAIKMIGGGVGGMPAPEPAMAQLASASMITQPMDGTTISNSKPVIKANLATMGNVDPGSVKMRVSGLGQVPAVFDPKTKIVSYQVDKPLTEKNYTVILSAVVDGKQAETRWNFNFDPTGKAAPDNSDLTAPARPQ